jgi:MFS family permease
MLARILRQAPHALAQVTRTRPDATLEERNYRNLLLNGAWFGPIDGGIYTYLPVFLARLGATPSIVGLVTSGPALIGILTYIPGGAYAERKTDMVKLVVWAAFIVRCSAPIIALLPFFLGPAYLPLAAVVIWSLMAIPNAVHIPAWTYVMQQAVPPERRAHLNGTRWALFSLVSAICIAIFGRFLDRTPFPAGYQIVFMISFGAAIMNLYYFNKLRVPPFRADRAQSTRSGLGQRVAIFFRPLTESPAFVRYNLATLPWRLAYNLPIALFSIYWVDNLQVSNTWIGLRGTVGYAALVVGYRMWGQVANRIGHRSVLLICGAVAALYPALTALAPSAPWLLPAAALWGLSIAGSDIGLFDMLLNACPDGRQPSYAATSNMLVSTVTFVAPLIGGVLAQLAGVRPALLVAALLQLLTTAFFLLLPNREQEALALQP